MTIKTCMCIELFFIIVCGFFACVAEDRLAIIINSMALYANFTGFIEDYQELQ